MNIDTLSHFFRKFIPKSLYKKLQPLYHWLVSFAAAIYYGFPAYNKEVIIIGITGTKGKSSTAEFMNSILTTAGYKTALTGTIHFKIGEDEVPNLYKMSMPGRFFMQRFIHDAVKAKCSHIILEITSEGSKFFRNNWIPLDAFIFTNLAPEHIESHGSFENYKSAKLRIVKSLKRSSIMVANTDNPYGTEFLSNAPDERQAAFLNELDSYSSDENGIRFTYKGTNFSSVIPGEFTISNIFLTVLVAEYLKIPMNKVSEGIRNIKKLPGRLEKVRAGQSFDVIIDYAHTPDSLEALYGIYENRHKVCVLGNCGGGRDVWKRPLMGEIADKHCDQIIFTNEDPYDEDPKQIIKNMLAGIKNSTKIIVEHDRREGIRRGLEKAKDDSVVIISGKGTDPYIMGPNGSKEAWSDHDVAEEEIKKILEKQ